MGENPNPAPDDGSSSPLLILFAVFMVWFPEAVMWPHALISGLLDGLFGHCCDGRCHRSSTDTSHVRAWPLR
jgi:hypothetical protein